jgi:hypothetical protein
MTGTPALDKFRKDNAGRCPPAVVIPVPRYTIEHREKTRVATAGSQRRCYNGCFPSSDWEMVWSSWSVLETSMPESRLTFWRELNAYAVSERGSDGESEYRLKDKNYE